MPVTDCSLRPMRFFACAPRQVCGVGSRVPASVLVFDPKNGVRAWALRLRLVTP